MERPIRVLHVEDDVEFASMTAAYLEGEGIESTTLHDASEALDYVDDVDCVVTDYEMPDVDGLDFLRQVRERDPDIPFIVFTGRGSEEVAAEAISAGVTDYLQKRGTGQYALLANRIENYVAKRRAEDERLRGYQAIERAHEGISLLDEDGRFIYVNEAFTDLLGYDRAELIGEHWTLVYHPEDHPRIREEILPAAADGGWTGEMSYRQKGGHSVLTTHSLSVTDDDELICVAQDLRDEERRRRELLEAKRFESLVNAVSEYAIFMLDTEGRVVTWNAGASRLKGYERPSVVGEHISLFYTDEDVADGAPETHLQDALDRGSTEYEGWRVRADGTRFWAHVLLTAVYDDGAHVGYAKVVHDQTERRERDQELERQREALATATRTNAIIRDIIRRIVDGTSREEITRDVCDRLTRGGRYQVALAGRYDPDTGFDVDVAVGIEPDAGAFLFERTADPERLDDVLRRGVVAVQQLSDGEGGLDHELGDLIESVVYVPLLYRSTVYGIVCLYADASDATTPAVEHALTEVGAAAGYGIHAVETERLLQADGVVELTFRTTDPELFMVELTAETEGGRATLQRLIPIGAERFLLYIAYEHISAETVSELAARNERVDEFTPVYGPENGSDGLVSVTENSSLVARLVDVGAKIHTAESVDGELELVVDVSPSTDVGQVVELVKAASPTSRLVSKHRVVRPVKRARAITEGVEAQLTERQLAALQAAFHGGYFDRPRKQTAEEVAATMGISASTFHQHLRIALDTVLTELFEGETLG